MSQSHQPAVDASEPTSPQVPSPSEVRLAELERDLEAARARVNEFARAYQAAEADKEGFKLRLQREREQLLDVEKGRVALALLETVDELDLCLSASDASPLARGVRLIREGLLKRLDATGIERVELEGTTYDANLAEATDLVPSPDEAQDGRVLEVQRACYRLKGKILRPGRVRVARYHQAARA